MSEIVRSIGKAISFNVIFKMLKGILLKNLEVKVDYLLIMEDSHSKPAQHIIGTVC